MAAFAYLLLPVTGLVAFLTGHDARSRFHGLQAIALGLVWPVALYVAALGSASAVQVVFVAGAVVWAAFLVLTILGRDPRLPVLGSYFESLAAVSTKDEPRSTSGS